MDLSLFDIYLFDTDALIDGYRGGRELLERLAREGRLKITPGVLSELKVGGDDVYTWACARAELIVVELTREAAQFSGIITERYGEPFQDRDNPGITYPGLIKLGGATDADPEVVSMGMSHAWTVVSNDRSVKAACLAEDYSRVLTWNELLTKESHRCRSHEE